MTSTQQLPPASSKGFQKFDFVKYYVGNAFQAASFYIARFGFEPFAYRTLETGSRAVATHVVRQNNIILAFESAIQPLTGAQQSDQQLVAQCRVIADEVSQHGDHVKDVAFTVDDARAVWKMATERGARSTLEPTVLKDEDGEVVIASVATYGNVEHTFVTRSAYTGQFLPGFKRYDEEDPLVKLTPPVMLQFVDHVVGNQPDQGMETAVEWYEQKLGFHRFWSVDEETLHTAYSSLRSTVMASEIETIKMPLNEPAEGKRKSQIQEYVDFYGGAGVQHIAFNTADILTSVRLLRARGVKFLRVLDTYYQLLRERLAASPVQIKEDLDMIQELGILVDFDDQGYLLQLFTKPQEDRPTLFYEIIQRSNHTGFGVGNFKSLFESIELDQAKRGNL